MKPSPRAPSLGIKEGFVTNFAEFWHMELVQFYAKATRQRMRGLIKNTHKKTGLYVLHPN
jgi:phage regulator Rha-like protein